MPHRYRAPVLITAPTEEPVSLAEARDWIGGITGNDRDAEINGAIVAARQWFENDTRTQVMAATWELPLDSFPKVILVPKGPVRSITSITYTDTADASQTVTLADTDQDLDSEPARIQPVDGEVWPATKPGLNKVLVRYDSGYASLALVPETIKAAIKMFILSMLDQPGAEQAQKLATNEVFNRLLGPHRALRIG